MQKRKIIGKIISAILLTITFFILMLLVRSADWFLDNFDGVSFSTAVYQLFSPMKGTGTEILNDYCNTCLYPSIYLAFFFLIIYNTYDILLRKLVLEWKICIGQKVFCLRIGNRFRLISKSCILGIGLLILGISVWQRAVLVGIPRYIRSITHASNLYETEYIAPDSVSITFPEEKRNLLLIYMESMETTYASTDVGGGKSDNYIPELTKLAEDNLFFTNGEGLGGAGAYTSTGWTMAGLLASLSGVNYKLPIEAEEYENFLPGLVALGDILENAGYRNYFMCGSDAVFGGRQDFFSQHGNYQTLDYYSAIEDGIIPADYYEFWGMEDQYLYEYAKRKLTDIAETDEPFNLTMLTVDTHQPSGYVCGLCDNQYSEQYANVAACASKQAGQFIEWVMEQDWCRNTTIIIVGDHKSMAVDFWDDIGDYDRRIYNCFINLPEGLTAVQTKNREFSTMDMFPTFLAALGVEIEGQRLGLGTNLFSAEQTLPEKMGNEFEKKLGGHSNYYYSNFIIADN